MTMYVCDRCGKHTGVFGMHFEPGRMPFSFQNPTNEFDLCGDCTEKLYQWIKEGGKSDSQ